MDAIEFIKQLRRMNEKGVPKDHFIYPPRWRICLFTRGHCF